jgi:8-oxo-dGTP diphosphatase
MMVKNKIKFFYREEFWFISAFINTSYINGKKVSKKLEKLVKKKILEITKKDAYRPEFAELLVNMAKNISLNCKWVPFIPNFPYHDENTDIDYNTLGYFQFNVEYYKNQPENKKKIDPIIIQQIPILILNHLKKSKQISKNTIQFDIESPIYIFITSNKTNPPDIEWNKNNIEKYDQTLSYWTVLYSGQWEDYSPRLYRERVQNNLSNRLSELHYINRNSGFIYMAEDNYKNYFDSYMKKNVLKPSAEMRAIIFSLRAINQSLDFLFLNTHSEGIKNIEKLEEKINNLRFLRGILQNALSKIYNELDYNRRQHYTKVLKHLIKTFDLNRIKNRVNNKFDLLYNSMQEIYQKQVQRDQEETEKALNILNILLGAGILADLVGLLMIALSLSENALSAIILNGTFAFIITGFLIFAILYYVFVKRKVKREEIRKAVDGIILDEEKNRVVLIKRKYPPFQGYYALPGGFIEKGESPENALYREIKEETNLSVSIIKKIGVYDDPKRDPRGKVHSTAYLCKIVEENYELSGKMDSLMAKFIPIKKLETLELAFDHRKILKDAQIFEKDSIFD